MPPKTPASNLLPSTHERAPGGQPFRPRPWRPGSLADALALEPLAGRLTPIEPITADLDLEPGTDEPTVFRDSRWRVRWPRIVDELLAVIGQ